MRNRTTIRKRILGAAAVVLVACILTPGAHAASKEIVQLQTQVQQLLDMVQRLQSTMDTRFAVLQNLAQQTADEATRMGGTVNALQQKINSENDALNGKLDASSGQVQSLNDSVDELKTRIDKLQKTVQDLQSQLQNIQSAPPGSVPTPGAGGASQPGGGSAGPGGAAMNSTPPAGQTPPLEQTFQAALGDYNAGKYALASSELQDVIRYYPMDTYAGSAHFYLGEIAYRQHNYDDAVTDYNIVLEQFSGNPRASAAQLHKGFALLELNRRDAGIHELRSLIQRHPQTPEAAQARARLNGMGVRINATAQR